MCPDPVSATDEKRRETADGNLRPWPIQMDTPMTYLSLTTTQGVTGGIYVFSTILTHNSRFAGDQ